MKPYYQDDSVTLYHGDCLDVLRALPDESVNACVTSPPYFGLRDYGVKGQHGAEESPAEYVETMRAVFSEVRRVLANDGTLWLNLGDSYAANLSGIAPTNTRNKGGHGRRKNQSGLPAKSLLGMPWRVAFALQDDGWILRNDVIWSKPNAMPESVTDRLSNRHEHLFMLSKSVRYWFDLDPIREPHADISVQRAMPHRTAPGRSAREGTPYEGVAAPQTLRLDQMNHTAGRNPGDVWTIPTQPFPEAHFAVMAPEIARRAIVAGCKPGGVVLDPYSGAGTTGMQATKNGRGYVGIDLSADYLDLSLRTRLAQSVLTIPEGGVTA